MKNSEIIVKKIREDDYAGGTYHQMWNLAYGNGIYVAVSTGGVIRTSNDGKVWVERDSGASESLRSVTYGAGRFVAVGFDVILSSIDGINWICESDSDKGEYSIDTEIDLCDVTYGNDLYVAVGFDGEICISSNGTRWSLIKNIIDGELHGVAYGAGRFVAVGPNGFVLTSTDGINWSKIDSALTYHYRIIYDNDMFISVGENGTIITSTDGINWSKWITCTDNNLLGVAYGNGLYVAIGTGGVILSSPDGINWSNVESGINDNLENIIYANNQFVIIGYGCGIFICEH